MATKPEFLVDRIGRNFEPWDGFQNTMPVLSLDSCKRKGPNWPIPRFSGGHL